MSDTILSTTYTSQPRDRGFNGKPAVPSCLFIVFIALILRSGWGIYRLVSVGDPTVLEFPDEQQYWQMAQALHAGDGLKDELGFRATRMPMYPVYLAVFAGFQNGLIFARILQWVIGAIAAGITGYLAASIWNLRTGLIAGLMVAFDPFLIFFSSLLLTETLFITIFLLFWWTLWPIIRSLG